MDRENTIKTKVELDVSNAEKSLNRLNDAKEESISLNNESAKSQGVYTKAIEAADDASGGLLKGLKALALNPFTIVLTALVNGFKFLQTAVQRSGKASETFGKIGAKISAIFNGFLAVLEPVVEFIGEKLLSALNDPKQAIVDLGNNIKENIINRFKALTILGDAIVKLFKGDFKGAAKAATDGVIQFSTGVTDATEKIKAFGEEAKKNFNEAAKATENLANAERRLVQNRISLEKQQLTSLRLAEEQRQLRDDTSKQIDERIAANQKLGEILDQQFQKELALAQQSLNLARAQQTATGDTIENLEAVGDAELKLLEIRERITGQRSEQLTSENALLKEQADLKLAEEQKALEEKEKRAGEFEAEQERRLEEFTAQLEQQIEFDEIELERKALNGEDTNEVEKEILRNRSQIEIAEAGDNAEKISAIKQRLKLEEDKIDKASTKANADKNKAQLENTIGAAAEAFGVTQELAVAQMIIAAPTAIGNSFKEAAKTYAPPLSLAMGALGAAGVIVPIVKGLADIKKTRFSKSKGGGGAGAGASISTSIPSGGTASVSSAANVAQGITPEVIQDLSANAGANLGTDTNLRDGASSAAASNISATTQGEVIFSESRFQDFRDQVQFREERTTLE